MKLFTGWVLSAGLVVAASAAQAQVLPPYEAWRSPYRTVSDVGGHYAAMPPEAAVPSYGPQLLPPQEVYTVLRESGFSPLGVPVQRGVVYTISVIDRGGDDGRLVIDARTGRILRFMPARRMGDRFDDALTTTYGPPGPPPATAIRGEPRPPRAIPKVASRNPAEVPVPKPRAGEARPLAARPATLPPQQSAAAPVKPVEPRTVGQAAVPAAVPAAEARPAPQILPTQEMPKAQGLE